MTQTTTGAKESMTRIAQFVCFKLGEEEYAIDINCVQEVLRPQNITPLPQLPDFVLGVVNVRGSVVPLFDLRKKLHLADKALDDHSRIILAQIGGALGCYLVDEVLDNIKLDATKIDPAPEVKMSIPHECVRGLGMVDTRMIVIIDHVAVDRAMQEEICSRLGSTGTGERHG